jgi:hypothetical protein
LLPITSEPAGVEDTCGTAVDEVAAVIVGERNGKGEPSGVATALVVRVGIGVALLLSLELQAVAARRKTARKGSRSFMSTSMRRAQRRSPNRIQYRDCVLICGLAGHRRTGTPVRRFAVLM